MHHKPSIGFKHRESINELVAQARDDAVTISKDARAEGMCYLCGECSPIPEDMLRVRIEKTGRDGFPIIFQYAIPEPCYRAALRTSTPGSYSCTKD